MASTLSGYAPHLPSWEDRKIRIHEAVMIARHFNSDDPALTNTQPLHLRIETVINYPAEYIYTCPQVFKYYVNDRLILTVDRPMRGKWIIKNELTGETTIRKFKYLPRPFTECGDLALDLYTQPTKEP